MTNRKTYWKRYGQEHMMGINHKKQQYLNSVWIKLSRLLGKTSQKYKNISQR